MFIVSNQNWRAPGSFFRFPGEASEAKVEDRAGRRGEVGRTAMEHNSQGF